MYKETKTDVRRGKTRDKAIGASKSMTPTSVDCDIQIVKGMSMSAPLPYGSQGEKAHSHNVRPREDSRTRPG